MCVCLGVGVSVCVCLREIPPFSVTHKKNKLLYQILNPVVVSEALIRLFPGRKLLHLLQLSTKLTDLPVCTFSITTRQVIKSNKPFRSDGANKADTLLKYWTVGYCIIV